MLAGNLGIVRLLLCLVIVRRVSLCSLSTASPTEEPEVAKVPPEAIPEASQVKPRIVQRTTVLKRANRFDNYGNSTTTLRTKNYEEDDSPATTHLPGPLSFESATRKTASFRPSVHLGEIDSYETRKSSSNPFNKVQRLKFENSVKIGEPDTDGARGGSLSKTSSLAHGPERATSTADGRKRNNRVKFFETDSRYGIEIPVEHPQQEYFQHEQQNGHVDNNDDDHHNNQHYDLHHDHQHGIHHNNQHHDTNGYNDHGKVPVDHETLVTFVYPQAHYGEVTARPTTLGRPVYPSIASGQVHVQNYEPVTDNVKTIYVKPSKFQGEVEIVTSVPATVPIPVPLPEPVLIQHYEYGAPASSEAVDKPEVLLHHQGSYEVLPQEPHAGNIEKPETVLYLTSHRETAYTRTRKFPYKFHHPGLGFQDNEYHFVQEGPHAYATKGRRISPWKKILHIIGTFIPLGLLLATLTPNVVKIGNATQPSVSKLRVVDLPLEHKRARLIDDPAEPQQDTCEDRSICELIVGGSDPRSSLLQSILWSLTNKSSDEEANNPELQGIIEAVKKKDCSIIDCRRSKDQ